MNKRICLMIDDDIDKKVRLIQAEWIKNNQESCSYSRAINLVIRTYF